MKFNNKFKTIFLDTSANKLDSEEENNASILAATQGSIKKEKVNIILSPSLYWVKKLSLPVKYVREVKKLLPSIFEDTLPEGHYSYYVYKSGDDFFAFAYEDKAILDVLSMQGIAASNVANVYFAQSEFQNLEKAVKVSDTQSIYVKDELVILVPSTWVQESDDLDLSDMKFSKHNITLQQFGHIVDNSSLYKIGAILVVLIVLIAIEYFITLSKAEQIAQQNSELFEKYKLKSTMMQNRSMLKKYSYIHEKQTKLREYISYMLSLKLKKDEKLSLLSLKNKTLIVEFTGVKKNQDAHITKILQSKNIKYKSSYKNDTLHVEITL